MANNFGVDRAALASRFVPILDGVYQASCLTSVLDGDSGLVREGANANELIIPSVSMDGLADYSRDSGFTAGEVTLTSSTVRCGYDRGRMFSIDVLDDQESANVAFGYLAGEFIRTHVAPELDAYRFAQYAGKAGIGQVVSGATLSTAAGVIAALRAGMQTMDNAEVPYEDRYLFITAPLLDLIDDQDTTKSCRVLSAFKQVIKVPQRRFYDGITLRDGTSSGQTAGGFSKTESTGADLNFLIVHKGAVIQYQKHVVPKIVRPEENPDADSWKFGYRTVGIADVFANKLAGVYKHMKAAG